MHAHTPIKALRSRHDPALTHAQLECLTYVLAELHKIELILNIDVSLKQGALWKMEVHFSALTGPLHTLPFTTTKYSTTQTTGRSAPP